MKFLRKISQVILICAALVTGQAYAGSINLVGVTWGMDATGSGDGEDVIGLGTFAYESLTYVELDLGTGQFTDYAVLFSSYAASPLAGIYATGTIGGYLDAPDEDGYANANFTSGSIDWYSASGAPILSMGLDNAIGSIQVDSTSGSFAFQYEITSVADGYFFVEVNGEWVDLSELISPEDPYYMDVISGVEIADDGTISDLATFYGITEPDLTVGFADVGIDYADVDSALGSGVLDGEYVTYNRGTSDLAVIPEPGMLSLMGLAFLGFAGFQSRRKGQRNS